MLVGAVSRSRVRTTPQLHPSSLTPARSSSAPTPRAQRDLVAVARTGSGKTLAYMISLVQRLGGWHVHAFCARTIILVPARERPPGHQSQEKPCRRLEM